ncbi:Hypothetical protein NocV09_10800090, partial [Nannochloropsis oceanica]
DREHLVPHLKRQNGVCVRQQQ